MSSMKWFRDKIQTNLKIIRLICIIWNFGGEKYLFLVSSSCISMNTFIDYITHTWCKVYINHNCDFNQPQALKNFPMLNKYIIQNKNSRGHEPNMKQTK